MRFATSLAAALGMAVTGASVADAPTCTADRDCFGPASQCRTFHLQGLPSRLCVPAALSASLASDGANAAERVQELFITQMLTDLDARAGALRPEAVREVLLAFGADDAGTFRDERSLREGLRAAYLALARLDRYQRLLLLRYLKRQLTTEVERRLFIVLDIVRHPDLDASTDVDAIKTQIRSEELRLQGMAYDRDAQCAQFGVLLRLNHQRVAAEFARTARRIEASNVPTEQRERALESARRDRLATDERLDATLGVACGAPAPAAVPVAPPPVARVPRTRRPVRYTIYSLDPPEMPLLADAAGVPPVTSASWDRLHVGKFALQQDALAVQQKRTGDSDRASNLQAYDEVAHAGQLLAAEMETARNVCASRQRARAAARDRLEAERAAIHEQESVMQRETYAATCPSTLNVMGCQLKKYQDVLERTRPLTQRLTQIDQEERSLESSDQAKAAAAACKSEIDDVTKRYQARMSDAAALMKMATAAASAASPAGLASYSRLQAYDPAGTLPGQRLPEIGFLKWGMDQVAEHYVLEKLLEHTGIRLDPLPPVPLGVLDVATHLAKLKEAETDAEYACWDAHFYALVALPLVEDSKALDALIQSFLQLKDPQDPDFKPCPKH